MWLHIYDYGMIGKNLPLNIECENHKHIYLNAKVLQLLLKCYLLLFDPNISLRDILIDKSNDLPSI